MTGWRQKWGWQLMTTILSMNEWVFVRYGDEQFIAFPNGCCFEVSPLTPPSLLWEQHLESSFGGRDRGYTIQVSCGILAH